MKLGEGMGRRLHGTDRLPAAVTDILGLNRKATFADLFQIARLWTRRRDAGELTGSAEENAYLAAELG
jgi:hypothetical protein